MQRSRLGSASSGPEEIEDRNGLTQSLFLAHKDDYPEHEQASLRQLYQAKAEAAAAGESSFRSFMMAVQQSASSVAILQQYFSNSIAGLLLPVDGLMRLRVKRWATPCLVLKGAAPKGLLQCTDTVMVEVERLLSTEQKATDFRSPDDGFAPDQHPTTACIRVVAYLSRVLKVAFTAPEGLNKQSFLSELGNQVHRGLLNHWQKFTFSPSAADVLVVAPENLASLFEGNPTIRKDALRFIQLSDDNKSAKIASGLSSIMS